MKKIITTVALTLAAASLAITADMADAEASMCPISEETLDFAIPGDGAVVAEEPLLFGVFEGASSERYDYDVRDISLVETESDTEIEIEEESVHLAKRLRRQTRLVPEQPLEAGEYLVAITWDSRTDIELISFTVDDTVEALPAPEAPEFEWYNERDRGECLADVSAIIEIERPPTAPDFYEVLIRDDDGTESLNLLPARDEVTKATVQYGADTDCVTVTGVMADGTRGESVEDCNPQLFGAGCFSGCQTVGDSSETGFFWIVLAALVGLFVVGRRRCKSLIEQAI